MKILVLIVFLSATDFINFKGFCQSNLGLNKNCIQSNTWESHNGSLAVDGDPATRSVTNSDINGCSWWLIDLGSTYIITNIIITNSNEDPFDTTNIFITIRDDDFTIYNPSQYWSFNNKTIQPRETFIMTKASESTSSSLGRYVTIWKYKPANVRETLTLGEVEIRGYSPLNKNCIQSNTWDSHNASLAVDGDFNTRSVAREQNDYSWWQIDFGSTYDLTDIIITNSFENPDDLNNIFITIRDDASTIYDPTQYWSFNNKTIQPRATFIMTKASGSTSSSLGRYVTIWRYKPPNAGERNVLTLTEVEIRGNFSRITAVLTTTKSISSINNQITSSTSDEKPQPNQTTSTTMTSIKPLPIASVSNCLCSEMRSEKDHIVKLAIGLSLGIGLFIIIVTFIIGVIIGKKYFTQNSNIKFEKNSNNDYAISKKTHEHHVYADLELEDTQTKRNDKPYETWIRRI